MKLLLVPTKPAQFNMAAAIYRTAPADKPHVLVASQDVKRMNLDANLALFDMPAPAAILDTSGNIDEKSAQLREVAIALCAKNNLDGIMLFGDLDPVAAAAFADPAGLPPLISVNAGVRSDAEPNAGWVVQRRAVEPNAAFAFTLSPAGVDTLKGENAHGLVRFAGDINDDLATQMLDLCDTKSTILFDHALETGRYVFASIAQLENIKNPDRMKTLLDALCVLSARTRLALLLDTNAIQSWESAATTADWKTRLEQNSTSVFTGNLPSIDLAALIKNASFVFSDMVLAQTMSRIAQKNCVVPRQFANWLDDGHATVLPPRADGLDFMLDMGMHIGPVMMAPRLHNPERIPASPATTIWKTLLEAKGAKSTLVTTAVPGRKPA